MVDLSVYIQVYDVFRLVLFTIQLYYLQSNLQCFVGGVGGVGVVNDMT